MSIQRQNSKIRFKELFAAGVFLFCPVASETHAEWLKKCQNFLIAAYERVYFPGRKNFDGIAEDYLFFENNSNEQEVNIQALTDIIAGLGLPEYFSFLDFGSGDGVLSEAVLRRLGIVGKLNISIVEPAETRFQYVERLAPFVKKEVEVVTGLGKLPCCYDLILANHSFYYLDDLANGFQTLYESLNSGGFLLVTMASNRSGTEIVSKSQFARRGLKRNQYSNTDLEPFLAERGIHYEKKILQAELKFEDITENRIKILRFIFGEHITKFKIEILLQVLDDYSIDGSIIMPIEDVVYIFKK